MYLENGTLLCNRYRIEEKLGVGGMAVVYRAQDERLDRSVTVKVLKEEYINDEESLDRFRTEARAVAKLTHPNIVNVYDVCQDGDVNFIVMEYIEGDTLKALIDEHAPFSNRLVLNVALNIAQALSHAHKHHIVHRDIKPQNILVSVDGTVKVTDFGIARAAVGSTLSTATNVLGSVHYFSPEQARGGYIDEKSDIYSLGVTMFEMATGRVPFDGETTVAVALKHLNEELPSLVRLNPKVSRSVEGIIRKATRKKADERYANINLMIADLRRALAEEGEGDNGEQDKRVIAGTAASQVPAEEPQQGKNQVSERKDREQKSEKDHFESLANRKKERRVILAAVLTALVIIAGIVVVFQKLAGDKNPLTALVEPKTVTVPNLVGQTYEDAQKQLEALGLELVKEGEEYSGEQESGHILKQETDADSQVETGTQVSVTVSKGLKSFTMPTLTDLEESDAVSRLKEAGGSAPVIAYEYNDEIPAGVVMKQDPAAGTRADANTKTTLTVSKGAELKKITVPNVVGKTESEAKTALEDAGLTVGRVTQVASNTVAQGKVITQTVTAGSMVIAKTTVGLAVSSGKKTETAPTTSQETPSGETTQTPSTTGTPSSSNTPKTKNFTVNAPAIGGDFGDTVYVQLIQVKEDGSSSIVVDEDRAISDFPFTVTLTGSGTEAVQLFLDGNYQWSESVNFN